MSDLIDLVLDANDQQEFPVIRGGIVTDVGVEKVFFNKSLSHDPNRVLEPGQELIASGIAAENLRYYELEMPVGRFTDPYLTLHLADYYSQFQKQ